jgi:dihydrofolate synthase/folylpolyglutamate synthase
MTPDDLAWLYALANEYRSINYDLRNMQALAHALKDPQNSFRSILIAGTNGKGSVARMLSEMMPDAGLYTSPHLQRLNERFRIGHEEISNPELKEVFEHVKAVAGTAPGLIHRPSYFEIVTAMAFCYFRDRNVKRVVLEVGLGGRLDATNVVSQDVSVITSIGIDHTEFLGDSLDQIAGEKAGIIKGREPVVVGPEVSFEVIRRKAGMNLVETRKVETRVQSLGAGYFEIDVGRHEGLRPSLRGRHQLDNVVVAVCAADCFGLDAADIRRGINIATWPGRLESFPGSPAFLLDGAHNVSAMQALASFLAEFHPEGVWMIFGAMADKQIQPMLDIITPQVRQIIFTRARSSRSKDPQELQTLNPSSILTGSIGEAIAYARSHAPGNSTVLICGSLYLIGEARDVLQ